MNPTREELLQNFDYFPETGEFTWRYCQRAKGLVGKKIRSKNGKGYILLSFSGKNVLAHRAAWFIHYGKWPTMTIDHLNSDKTDNRICNLEDVSGGENSYRKARRDWIVKHPDWKPPKI